MQPSIKKVLNEEHFEYENPMDSVHRVSLLQIKDSVLEIFVLNDG